MRVFMWLSLSKKNVSCTTECTGYHRVELLYLDKDFRKSINTVF